MLNFNKKEYYTEEDINLLISSSTEESIHLDFKASGSLDKTDGKKNEIAKDVSAFANSDGGIIIYGISEIEFKADSLSFIDGTIFTKEWLEQVINSKIQRRIPGIIIYPIRFNDDPKQSIYLVKIPLSYNAPHMTSDKKFYRRFNFQSIYMEEYEIRELYNRKANTELELEEIIINNNGVSKSGNRLTYVGYRLDFQIRNISNVIETLYKLEISLPRIPYLKALVDINPIKPYFIRDEGEMAIFSVPNSSPIFQNELTTMVSAFVKIEKETFHLFNDIGITVKVYYSSGTKERTYKLLDVLKNEGKLLKESTWA